MRARLLASLGSVTALGVWVYPLGRLEPLALGILLAWGWSRWRSSWPAWHTWTGILAAALGSAAVTGLIRLGTEAGIEIAWFRLWGYPAVDLILAGMLGGVLMAGGGPFAQPALVYLGRISYGLYVFHLMVIALVLLHFRLWPVQLPLSFGLTLGLAALSYGAAGAAFPSAQGAVHIYPVGARLAVIPRTHREHA
jgi:peptidoglycan/LPS O-acetylase OafA/YrhL